MLLVYKKERKSNKGFMKYVPFIYMPLYQFSRYTLTYDWL